jgi:orotate phosphoribosyltransferase-like protein
MNNPSLPPKFIYDKIRELRKEGLTNEEISKKLHIRLFIVENIL